MIIRKLLNKVFFSSILLIGCAQVEDVKDEKTVADKENLKQITVAEFVTSSSGKRSRILSKEELKNFNLFTENERISFEQVILNRGFKRHDGLYEGVLFIDCLGGGECKLVYFMLFSNTGVPISKILIKGELREEVFATIFEAERKGDVFTVYKIKKEYEPESDIEIKSDTVSIKKVDVLER